MRGLKSSVYKSVCGRPPPSPLNMHALVHIFPSSSPAVWDSVECFSLPGTATAAAPAEAAGI